MPIADLLEVPSSVGRLISESLVSLVPAEPELAKKLRKRQWALPISMVKDHALD